MSDYKGFQSVQLTRPSKSTFDLSHDKRLTTRMGRLTPVLTLECVPSDYFRGSSDMLVRLAPLLAPIYDQLNVFVHFFFVPNRLLWEDWEEFITGGRLGVGIDPLVAPIPPFIDIGVVGAAVPEAFQKSHLLDYLGVPNMPFAGENFGALEGINLDYMPVAAYVLIWYDYYRDRNFTADSLVDYPLPSGEFAFGADLFLQCFTRNYKHDYFTSALPFTQRGQQVLIPIDTTVTYLDQSRMIRSDTDTPLTNDGLVGGNIGSAVPGGLFINKQDYQDDGVAGRIENIDTMSNTTSTINDFRSAYALQVWMERNAIGGSRYNESTEAHFGVKPQDSRLQRPEYIGGGRIPIKIAEVVSTAYSQDGADATVPLANMGGHGVTFGNTNRFSYFCTEHGFIMGILSIMNPPSYHQGLSKMWRRRSFLDYPWPTFAKLGEQQVDKAELYANFTNLNEDADGQIPLFGYQSRYADWKYIPNSNHGDFHDTLLFWTLTREFDTSPELGEEFNLFDMTTQDRIFAVNGDADNFWIYVHNNVSVKRPLPYFATPNTMGFI